VTNVSVTCGFEPREMLGLPREHLVGHALERLPSMTKPPLAGSRAPEVNVAEPAGAPPVAPLRGQHHEVERVRGLDLEPAETAPPGLIGASSDLAITPSCPAASACS
jgi:hypothetical protein